MLDTIANELAKSLQDNLIDFSKDAIAVGAPDPKKLGKVPTIAVASSNFTFEDAGVGGGGSDDFDEPEDYFNGDGSTCLANLLFQFLNRPIRRLELGQ